MNKNKKIKGELTLDEFLKNIYDQTITDINPGVQELEKSEANSSDALTPSLEVENEGVEAEANNETTILDEQQFSTTEPLTCEFDPAVVNQHKAIIEAGLFLAGNHGIKIHQLKRMLDQWAVNSDYLHDLIKKMKSDLDHQADKGLTIEKFSDHYKFITKPELHEPLSKMIKTQVSSALTPSLLESLAIIAYNEPCTKSIIAKIRNIDPTGNIDKLIKLNLIYKHKRAEVPGKPWLYKLTSKFFDLFGIKSVSQLPKVSVKFNVHNNDLENDDFYEQNLQDRDFFDLNRDDIINTNHDYDDDN